MSAIRYDIRAEQGASFSIEFRLMAGDKPVSLEGATARAQVRENEFSPAVLVDLSSQAGGILIDPVLGSLRLNFSGAQTAAVRSESRWDSFVYLANGESIRVAFGDFVAVPTVTR